MRCSFFPLLCAVALACACEDFLVPPRSAELRWTIDPVAEPLTRASAEIPDTNDFLLTITDSKGKVLYDGAYGDSPESLLVDAGSYTVAVRSIPFTTPAFARPQYGDEQVVVVRDGAAVTVRLTCTLRNAGVRLSVAPDFLSSYPDGVLYLKSPETRLMYSYSEKRIAYFHPGPVSLILYDQGKDETLLTRTLEARQILSLSLSAPAAGHAASSSIQLQLDTLKNWISESYIIGGDSSGGGGGASGDDLSDALSAGDAASHVGENDVWVVGYIVGGDLSTAASVVKTSGITKNTHIAIAPRSSITAKASCVAVELPKGEVRDALNLVDHPDLIGSRVYVQGSLVASYFGTTGLKSTRAYALR